MNTRKNRRGGNIPSPRALMMIQHPVATPVTRGTRSSRLRCVHRSGLVLRGLFSAGLTDAPCFVDRGIDVDRR